MTGLLPIYQKGHLKQFQYQGNYESLAFCDKNYPRDYMPTFQTKEIDTAVNISLCRIYSYNNRLLKLAKDYNGIVNARTLYTTVTNPTIYIQLINRDGKFYFQTTGEKLLYTFFSLGYHDIYFSDGTNEFESDMIFSCGYLDNIENNYRIWRQDADYRTIDGLDNRRLYG
jgi:hypothetical protein